MSFVFAARILFAILFGLVTYLTVTTNPETTEGGMALTRWLAEMVLGQAALADKVAHFLAYGALGAAAMFANLRLARRRIVTVLALAAYGALLEGVQALGGVRSPEAADAIANAFGALCAYPGYMILTRLAPRLRAV